MAEGGAVPTSTSRACGGNTPVANRSVWYKFNGVDDVDTLNDEYHVDVRFTVNTALAEGDLVVQDWRATGTHTGPLLDISLQLSSGM